MSEPQIVVKSPSGASASLPAGATTRDALSALEAVKGRSAERGPSAQILAARVDGRLCDLSGPVSDGATVEPVPADSDEGRTILRHSCAHILAQAVTDLFPEAKFAIGPPIADGFYYDFEVARPFTPEDLQAIESRMREIIREGQAFRRRELTEDEALALFADQPYKREIIAGAAVQGVGGSHSTDQGVEGQTVSVYDNIRADGSIWVDLCRGPHIPTTKWVPAFALQRVAGAYWRGDEHNPMLQRIYGTAWESRKALAAHLERLEEARKRDHRRLGRALDLISFPEEVGPGIAVWHPRGAIVRKQMEDYSRAEHLARGYQPVFTPHIGRSLLWEISGHLGWYAEGMYPPMELDDGERYYPKPMNCPFHILVYRSQTRSYRDLPMRLYELGTVYRYERSGTLHGLLRARGFTQDDSHIFCTPEQAPDEIGRVIEFTLDLFRDFGFAGPSRVALSTRPQKGDTFGSDEGWARAEGFLRRALDASGLDWVVDEGEGAFYAPKVDFQITDAIGRPWQLSTVQVDLMLPERFGLTYAGADGAEHRPVMIHRALFGSLDRFFAILVEHYAGAFPTWLAPVQAVVVPIADRHHDYGRQVTAALTARGLRAEVDTADAQMGAKIRRHQVEKVPYQLVVGDAEVADGTVSVRTRSGDQRKGVPLDEFAEDLVWEVSARGRASSRRAAGDGDLSR